MFVCIYNCQNTITIEFSLYQKGSKVIKNEKKRKVSKSKWKERCVCKKERYVNKNLMVHMLIEIRNLLTLLITENSDNKYNNYLRLYVVFDGVRNVLLQLSSFVFSWSSHEIKCFKNLIIFLTACLWIRFCFSVVWKNVTFVCKYIYKAYTLICHCRRKVFWERNGGQSASRLWENVQVQTQWSRPRGKDFKLQWNLRKVDTLQSISVYEVLGCFKGSI